MLKQMRQIGMCLLLSVVLTSNTWGRESITIYQTQDLKVENLQRINHNAMDVTLVELGKLEKFEAALTRRVNLSPGVSEKDASRRIRKQLDSMTVKALTDAWEDVIQAEQQGVDRDRLPAVFYRGEIHHDVRDIRTVFRSRPGTR
jgi:hypothetical protein